MEVAFATDRLDIPAIADLVQLSDYDEICEVMRSTKFVQGAYQSIRDSFHNNTISVVDGAAHLKRRNILSSLFNDAAVNAYRENHLYPITDRSLDEVTKQHKGPGKVKTDLVTLSQRSVFRLAAAISGIDGLDDPKMADHFIELLRVLVEGVNIEWTKDDPDVVMARASKAQATIEEEFFKKSYERRKALVEEAKRNPEAVAKLPADVLTKIIQNPEAWQDGDRHMALREICIFLVAGSQTTANSFVSLVLRLDHWFKTHPEDRVGIETNEEFLRNAVVESLRMTVAAPARSRIATQDVRLTSGREIKAGQRVALLFIPANADKARFGADADVFNPQRKQLDNQPWGLTFGHGAHSCPGRPLVTGNKTLKQSTSVDGSLVSLTRRFYAAGMELDPTSPPVPDPATHYDLYVSVPILLSPRS